MSKLVWVCLVVAVVLGWVVVAACGGEGISDPSGIVFPQGEYVGDIDQIGFNEPSGITFDAKRGTLFAVGDEGDICEIARDGKLVKQAHLMDADFEGITLDPSTGLLYVVVEGEEKILEVDPEGFKVLRQFPVDRTFNGMELLKAGGQGVEAITFVPEASHPQGGTFYLANQGFTFELDKDPSVIVEVVVPIKQALEGGSTGKIIRAFSIGVVDIADMHYDMTSDHIYAISDATNTFWEITRSGDTVRGYAFPGDNQEGITVDGEGWMYVAQDSGGIIKFKWTR
jgi:uncharacterized protein YjiK